jgi:hypothetical protein
MSQVDIMFGFRLSVAGMQFYKYFTVESVERDCDKQEKKY